MALCLRSVNTVAQNHKKHVQLTRCKIRTFFYCAFCRRRVHVWARLAVTLNYVTWRQISRQNRTGPLRGGRNNGYWRVLDQLPRTLKRLDPWLRFLELHMLYDLDIFQIFGVFWNQETIWMQYKRFIIYGACVFALWLTANKETARYTKSTWTSQGWPGGHESGSDWSTQSVACRLLSYINLCSVID